MTLSEVEVPQDLRGFVIGREGQNLKKIKGDFDVDIIAPAPDEKVSTFLLAGDEVCAAHVWRMRMRARAGLTRRPACVRSCARVPSAALQASVQKVQAKLVETVKDLVRTASSRRSATALVVPNDE